MSITFDHTVSYTINNNSILSNQPAFTYRFKLRCKSGGDDSASGYLFFKPNSTFVIQATNLPGGQWYIKVMLQMASGSEVSYQVTLARDTTYDFMLTSSSAGRQIWRTNAVPNQFGSYAENTASNPYTLAMGGTYATGLQTLIIDDLGIIHGYEATDQNHADLRDGKITFAQLVAQAGGAVIWAAEYSFYGTQGATPVIGDMGLQDLFSNSPVVNFSSISGTGTASYSAPLIYLPSVGFNTLRISTSGKTITGRFKNLTTGATVLPTSCPVFPTIKKNGVSLGSLTIPKITGIDEDALFSIPNPTVNQIVPGDTVTLSMPTGAINTAVDLVAGVTDYPVENCAGRSHVGTDALVKTFKPGVNFGWPFTPNMQYSIPKNLVLRCANFGGVTQVHGHVTAMSGTQAVATLYQSSQINNFDNTDFAGETGYYSTGWNAPGVTTFDLVSLNAATTTVTEMTDGDNPGVGGIGIARVFNVQRTAGSNSARLDLGIRITDSTQTPNYSGLVCYGPSDFTYTPGVPTVLDRSNPYAISNRVKQRFINGLGSARFHESVLGWGGNSSMAEPEHLRPLTDEMWGWGGLVQNRYIRFTQARPWIPANSPYVYTDLFGDPYNCTLATSLNGTDAPGTLVSVTITDAATAPVLVGLKLLMPSGEKCRVMSGSGTNWMIERGSSMTTVAAQAAGTIQVLGRKALSSTTFNTGRVVEIVTQDPHLLRTAMYSPIAGYNWPAFTWMDGATWNIGNWTSNSYVTSANTFLWLGGSDAPNPPLYNTVTQTYTLDPANQYFNLMLPEAGSLPYEFIGMTTSQLGCDLHMNLGSGMNDDCVITAFRKVRDNTTPGRNVWVELANEPWNWAMGPQLQLDFHVGQITGNSACYGMAWQLDRSMQIKALGQAVFNEGGRNRGSEIKIGINNQMVNAALGVAYLAYAQTKSYLIDAMYVACYQGGMGAITPTDCTCAWQYDDDQFVDQYINYFTYRTALTSDNAYRTGGWQQLIANYTAATGHDCKFIAYEGGFESYLPEVTIPTLTVNVSTGDTTIHVSSSDGFVAGQYILVGGTELMTIASINGTTWSVNRALSGLALISVTAKTHNAGDQVKSLRVYRNMDIQGNPNLRQAEMDFYASLQAAGYYRANIYGYCFSTGGASDWPIYTYNGQMPSKGDGLNGVKDNRHCLMMPGKTYSKAYTTNLDLNRDSVRGQGFLDWMQGVSSGTTTGRIRYLLR